MSNVIYDQNNVLNIVLEYLYTKNKDEIFSLSFEKLYSEIINYASVKHKKIKMPAISQMRKIIIAELKSSKNDDGDELEILYTKGDRLTSRVVYRLTERYYDVKKIEEILMYEYKTSLFCETPIICTIKLPPVEILDTLAKCYSKKNKKSISWGRINYIGQLCKKIKAKEPSLIIAVIPESNRMIYLNKKGNISKQTADFNVMCDTLCVFIKNSSEGRAFVDKINNTPPHYLNKIMKE